ncbi:transcriptional regulator with XRE-family HTH domain [Friedmanniella endophytica]|uniref:Transcriptional regulator with XRE-family HTH domain n=1 Tax=Microlunatus kandeliicorticis TaxID=1759536 RepID=A0A7W3IVX2_9ACTN|nr:helix-turn-helix domain-containing protein [Microlunatus kandeliicorticis]MBA8796248.1 transcriptional regulator with XRE-family HTH domain [Microlunatus kandeliicorticis]
MARIKTPLLGDQINSLGEFIAAQRRSAELSLRQLAEQAGVSNPYLSQIERGLRRPSAEVLQQLSKALRISAETLYVRAGILDPEDHPATSVELAVLADPAITERQKRVLIDVYASFVRENEAVARDQADPSEPATPENGPTSTGPTSTGPTGTGRSTRPTSTTTRSRTRPSTVRKPAARQTKEK